MKNVSKFSSNKYKEILETIEKIAIINNEDEKNKVLSDIYIIAHTFAGSCENPHSDWEELYEKIKKELKDY